MEVLKEFFLGGEVWSIVLKVLATAILSALLGLLCTAIGKLIAKCKSSRIRKYAAICVKAAEQKFPNEGKKMGPEKMAYVMDQLAIRFPKIRNNQYLYNIVEAAVYELNAQRQQEAAIEEFKATYNEDPIAIKEATEEEPAGLLKTVDEALQEAVKEKIEEQNKTTKTGTAGVLDDLLEMELSKPKKTTESHKESISSF